MRQLYDTLTRPSVMQCNTTKVIRAFKCNMMAKKKSILDLIFASFQMPTVIIHREPGPSGSAHLSNSVEASGMCPYQGGNITQRGRKTRGWISCNIQGASSGHKEMSCDSQGVTKCHVQSWHKGCSPSESCFKGKSLLLSLSLACIEEGLGMCWLSLIYSCSTSSWEKILPQPW